MKKDKRNLFIAAILFVVVVALTLHGIVSGGIFSTGANAESVTTVSKTSEGVVEATPKDKNFINAVIVFSIFAIFLLIWKVILHFRKQLEKGGI